MKKVFFFCFSVIFFFSIFYENLRYFDTHTSDACLPVRVCISNFASPSLSLIEYSMNAPNITFSV